MSSSNTTSTTQNGSSNKNIDDDDDDDDDDRFTVAEDLRLQGNDAFVTKDFERAVELYTRSVACKPQAKAYSNLAAALCKLGRYQEAAPAAERATSLDPKWAKGWWRRGVVCELLKRFATAHQYFQLAVKLEPNQKAFQTALKKIQKRLNIDPSSNTMATPDGFDAPPVEVNGDNNGSIRDSPAVKAFLSVLEILGTTNIYLACDRYKLQYQDTLTPNQYPTTRQYLYLGMQEWVGGMKGAIGQIAIGTSQEAYQQWMVLQTQFASHDRDRYIELATQMFGGIPEGNLEMAHLVSGYSRLGGLYFAIEMGANAELCPPGQIMSRSSYVNMCQLMGVMRSIDTWVEILVNSFDGGRTLKLNQAVFGASSAFYANAGRDTYPCSALERNMKADPDPSPQNIIKYIKKQLTSGRRTWADMQRYVSTIYRGTILWSFVVRTVPKQIAEAHQYEKWAITFIDLADKEFRVNQEQSFQEKGSAFQNSLRIGIMMSHMQTQEFLRDNNMNGPYPMEYTLDLAVKIIEMAQKMPSKRRLGNNRKDGSKKAEYENYQSAHDDVAFRRKPLVLAHSTIGSGLNAMNMLFPLSEFQQIAKHHGFLEDADDGDEVCDPFALIANHYKIAAENALPDDIDTAVYWYATAANMAFASLKSGFTLGDLREAIRQGQAAEMARDVELFGENKQKDGSFEIVAKLVAKRYAALQKDDDSFVLPQVKLVRSKPGSNGKYKSHLEVDGDVFCPNFHEYELKEETNMEESEQRKKLRDWVDTSEAERQYGAAARDGIPSLETLCIRALHKSGCDYAKGETDGAVIQYKAMIAATTSE